MRGRSEGRSRGVGQGPTRPCALAAFRALPSHSLPLPSSALLQVGDHTVGVKTSALEEKRAACDMLVTYLNELQGSYFPVRHTHHLIPASCSYFLRG